MTATPTTPSSQLFIRQLRRQIDRLDDRLLNLLVQRLLLARELGLIKRQAGLPLRDAERERQLLERLSRNGTTLLPPDEIQRIFGKIIEASLAGEERDAIESR